ncbi:SUMF1/EgtB/PvdO family nonheme iron enzyme [Lacinutrix sp. C3R15]|uniref:formylglycine-generating enzyme family protein n=1 Tax=Flavobacteriaceae TaxID=49546 RepID=UPI001C08E4A7|nr:MULTISPECIES: SUMF1/EgtB/PvdO family nonheme iron enzyme [Flavobacteriaceae]MBU2938433.1 SUMF1/EgtB/PvdO family nonheme iron enzyme [Lacinutrix sp. C3R15]MDO6621747.1 SUMF1/EgtB/PvdO family nonheme iron enzyme [Oceanihabitans sp. 1_MG-2023]
MKTKITTLIALLFCCFSFANNITVSNISLENLNEPDWVQVEFDLSWENSWRLSAGPSNWDAAWVFIKYRANNGEWNHVQLALTDFVAPTGSTIDITADGVGAFIYRDSDGSGDINLQNIRLRWNYALNGVNPNDVLDIQVFAIEMVYVPEGPFYVGGTIGDEVGKFYEHPTTTTSFHITSENAIAVGAVNGNLYYASSGDFLGPIPTSFPKGYNDFYVMKYEVSESQWVGFFNALTETQKANRDITGATGKNSDSEINANTVSWLDGTSSATTLAPDRSIAYTTSGDMLAYLDWSGLRPMTELEYEKACRGPIIPKPGEFAWGNANITTNAYTTVNNGEANELITNPDQATGNAAYSITLGTFGPVRNGIFAASAINKNREETGGSYYGIMELSGNVYERCITIGNLRGRQFTGNHGDGIITETGDSNVTNWPLFSSGEGFSYRGGGWINAANFLRVSDRFDAASNISGSSSRIGIRAARTAE